MNDELIDELARAAVFSKLDNWDLVEGDVHKIALKTHIGHY